MQGAAEVEDVFLGNLNPRIHPQAVVPLKHAGGTVASRTDLPTGIAADAAVKLGEPESHPFGRGHRRNPLQVRPIVRNRSNLRWHADPYIVEDGRPVCTAAAFGGLLPRLVHHPFAGYTDDEQAGALYLLLRQQDVERTTITRLDDNAHPRGFFATLAGLFLVVQVNGQVMDALRPPDQTVRLGSVIDDHGARPTPTAHFIADHTIHLLFGQQAAGMLTQFLGQRFVHRCPFPTPLETLRPAVNGRAEGKRALMVFNKLIWTYSARR
jgi:hypothetical protein